MFVFSPSATPSPPVPRASVLLRGATTWLAVTLGAAALTAVALPELLAAGRAVARGQGVPFDRLVVALCAGVALTAAVALWWLTTDVVLGVLRRRVSGPARPGPVRALLLAACGAAAIAGTTSAAAAVAPHVVVTAERDPSADAAPGGRERALDGLPLPDRALGGTADPRREPRATAAPPSPESDDLFAVRPGDSLWAIAADRLGARATVAEITAYWHRIHALNADVIGPDPDLVLPGQLLRLPPTA